ncbi:MAG: hypothetical protein ACI9MC_003268, partial [Kiritimatiellia bacterium]
MGAVAGPVDRGCLGVAVVEEPARMRWLLLMCSLAGCVRSGGAIEAAGEASGLRLDFATQAEGAAILGRSDAFSRGFSTYDLAIRERSSEADYLTRAETSVVAWTPRERKRWGAALDDVSKAMEGLQTPSIRVILVKTSADLEFGLPHTRASAVILPKDVVRRRHRAIRLLAHELFHVLSRHDPAFADRVYPLLGFAVIADLRMPQHLEPRRISNPDAISHRHALPVESADLPVYIVPFVVGALDVQASLVRPLVDNLRLHLMVIDPVTGELSDGSMYREAYDEQVARNTSYVLHPDEALADNFALLILRRLGHQLAL